MEENGQYKRWTAARKVEVVIRVLRGESLDVLSREFAIEVHLLEEWRARAVESMAIGLKTHSGDPLKRELDNAMKRIGELIMENELLQIKASRAPSFLAGRSKK